MAPGTWQAYSRSIENFGFFRNNLKLVAEWPVPTDQVALWVASLSLQNRAPSTINLHLSALAFAHKMNSWADPCEHFIIKKLREGCKRTNGRVDGRLPITPLILSKLIEKLPCVCSSGYEALVFKAAFLIAFFGFLRVSEFTVASKSTTDTSRVLTVDDVRLLQSGMVMTLRFSKTDQLGCGSRIQIERASVQAMCPVSSMSRLFES